MELRINDLNILKECIIEAANSLYKNDYYLIEHDVHEVTLTHRLALYLEEKIKKEFNTIKFNFDIEYNKNYEEPKRLVPGEDGKRPDIIIHRRGNNDYNLIIIELKKNKGIADDDSDDRKLKGATSGSHDFKYDLGAYINIKKDKVIFCWYTEGRKLEEKTIEYLNRTDN